MISQIIKPYEQWNRYFWIILSSAIIVRIIIYIDFPHAIWAIDSISYYSEFKSWLQFGKPLPELSRTIGYPFFLMAVYQISHDFFAVTIVQTILGLLLSILWYSIFYRLSHQKNIPLIFFGFIVLSTSSLNFEKNILTEFMLWFLMGLFFLTTILLTKNKKLYIFVMLGVISGTAILVKTVTIFLVPIGIYIVVATYYKESKAFLKIVLGGIVYLVISSIIILSQIGINYYSYQYIGLSKMGSKHLFAVTAHFIDFDSPKNKKYKDLIKPSIKKYHQEILGSHGDIDWIIYHQDGACKVLKQAILSRDKLEKVYNELAMEAIQNSPFQFVKRTVIIFIKTVTSESGGWIRANKNHVIATSWRLVQQENMEKFNQTHPAPDPTQSKEFTPIDPFHSIGSFFRYFFYTLNPTRFNSIWFIGFLLSFYLIYKKEIPLLSPLTSGYLIILGFVLIHSMLSINSQRYIYPVHTFIVFYTFLFISYISNYKKRTTPLRR